MKLRAEYVVGSDLKFLGNLDMINLMSRALRRADIPYALSKGFNPHIKLSMGTVLPVGVWGRQELFDLELNQAMAPDNFKLKLNQVLPDGMKVTKCIGIGNGEDALMKVINAAAYSFIIKRKAYDFAGLAEAILSRTSLKVKSRGKKKDVEKDIRPGIYKITLEDHDDSVIINIWVNVGEPVNVRYDELLDLMSRQGIEPRDVVDVFRSGNYIRVGDNFYSPLEKVR